MRRAWFIFAVVLMLGATARGQIGKSVLVEAGTPADQSLKQIDATPDGPEKVALIDKFMAEFGKGELELLGDQLYVSTYVAQKNYPKAFEYGEKVLALDPENLATAVNLVRAAEEMGDTQKLFGMGERVAAILSRYKASPAPQGYPDKEWQRRKADTLASFAQDLNYVQAVLFNAAYDTVNPKAKASLMERYATAFPDSSYTLRAEEEEAFAYQQAQDIPKMVDIAQKVLAADPNNVGILILLADYWSERGQQLDKAAENAQKALGLLAEPKKPEGVSDEQWQQQVSLQKGLAYSSLGQVYVNKGSNAKAVEAFKQANPLLKSNPTSYGRNLYRLGFTLAKMKQIPEARAVLTEAVSVNSPYRGLAQQTLDKIGGRAGGTRKDKS